MAITTQQCVCHRGAFDDSSEKRIATSYKWTQQFKLSSFTKCRGQQVWISLWEVCGTGVMCIPRPLDTWWGWTGSTKNRKINKQMGVRETLYTFEVVLGIFSCSEMFFNTLFQSTNQGCWKQQSQNNRFFFYLISPYLFLILYILVRDKTQLCAFLFASPQACLTLCYLCCQEAWNSTKETDTEKLKVRDNRQGVTLAAKLLIKLLLCLSPHETTHLGPSPLGTGGQFLCTRAQ